MSALLELQKQMEIDFLKEHSYEQINEMFREMKTKLDEAESKVKNLGLFGVIKQREMLIAFTKHRNKTNCDIITELDIDNFLEAINSL